MEAKLAEYRAKKNSEQKVQDQKKKVWNFLTLQFLRRPDPGGANTDDLENQEQLQQPWTRIDYAILVVKLVMWSVGQIIFVKLGFGAVYLATSAFALIWLSFGKEKRQEGQLSAYSVFNPNCQNIQGTLTAEQFESEIRHKKIS